MNNLSFSIHVILHKENQFFGIGVAELLLQVYETGSLHKACENKHISYSKGWKILKFAEHELGFKLLDSKAGGIYGGGSEITEEGKKFAKCYMNFRKELYETVDILFKKYFLNYL